jgi:hypothetical protein
MQMILICCGSVQMILHFYSFPVGKSAVGTREDPMRCPSDFCILGMNRCEKEQKDMTVIGHNVHPDVLPLGNNPAWMQQAQMRHMHSSAHQTKFALNYYTNLWFM